MQQVPHMQQAPHDNIFEICKYLSPIDIKNFLVSMYIDDDILVKRIIRFKYPKIIDAIYILTLGRSNLIIN